MLLIVLYHCLCFNAGSWNYFFPDAIYSRNCRLFASTLYVYHLPIFFFLSGFLYGYLRIGDRKYSDYKRFLINKFRRLLIPYIVWGVFTTLLWNFSILDFLMGNGLGHLWFLYVLFVIFLLVHPFSHYLFTSTKKFDIMVLTVFYFISWLCIAYDGMIGKFGNFLPYFILGVFSFKYNFLQRISNSLLVTSIVCLGSILISLSYCLIIEKYFLFL